MRIALGCDEIALDLKKYVKKLLEDEGHEVDDFGVYKQTPVLYPDIAVEVAFSIVQRKNERGILICGTGIGMAIMANKVPGIRAAVCHDLYSTERSRKSNDAQIMTIGARVVEPELVKELVLTWLRCGFDGGRSLPKVNRIKEYEQQFIKEYKGV